MQVEDMVRKGWTKPEHILYVVEEVRKSDEKYTVKRVLVEAWARRAGLTLEPWMVTESKLVVAQEVS